jgi:hypothetical protein
MSVYVSVLVLDFLPITSFSPWQLTMSKWDRENKSHSYKLDGSEALGSYLQVKPCSNEVPQVSKCSFQWYRLSSEGSWREVISGTVLLMKFLAYWLCSFNNDFIIYLI